MPAELRASVTVHDAWRNLFEMNPEGYAFYCDAAEDILSGMTSNTD